MGSQACAARTGLYLCSAPLPQVSEGDEARNGKEARADEEVPSVGQTRLQEPEDNEIRTVHAGDTPYTSAASFEDLPISGLLLQVSPMSTALGRAVCAPAASQSERRLVCTCLSAPAAGAVHGDEV